jgi:hypothetical protein
MAGGGKISGDEYVKKLFFLTLGGAIVYTLIVVVFVL